MKRCGSDQSLQWLLDPWSSFRGDDQSFPIVRAGERLSGIGADFEVGFIHTEAFSFVNHLIFSGKIVEMEKTYTCLMVQKPMVCAKYSLHENDWGANELFPAWQLNVWNGEDFLTSISESYANLHLQFWLGVSVSPAIVLLKGFASSNHKVISPILLPVQISETVSHCPGGISVMPSRTVAKPSYLRLRGGGDSSASSSCECCCELAPRTLACSLGDSAKRVVYTMHTDRPATQYFLLLYGGEFRDGDFTEHLAIIVKDKVLAVVIDKRVGAYLHDTSVPEVLDWVVSLAKNTLCLGIIASPVCGPWCALRGQGHGPGILFSTRFPDGKRDAQGRVIDGAADVIKGLESMCNILLAGHSHGAGVLVEHPVSRKKGSRFAIPGREFHSTMWDTSVMIALNEVMQFTSIFGDLCPPPLNGSSQKTTNWMATRHWVVAASKRLNKLCPHPVGTHKSLRSDANETTNFATAEGRKGSVGCRDMRTL